MNSIMLGLSLLVAAPAVKEVPKKDPPTLLGEWTLEKIEIGNEVAVGLEMRYTFKQEGIVEVEKKGLKKESAPYSHDPKAEPKLLDLTEPSNGKTMHMIYKVEGDTLTMMTDPQGKRPKSFDMEGMKVRITMKRVNKD